MKMKNRKIPILLLSASIILLLLSTVGSARAALTYYSENYEMEVTVSSIGVTLNENGKPVSFRNYLQNDWSDSGSGQLLQNMLAGGETLVPGRNYVEKLSVTNSGAIESYVRVVLCRSWQKENGQKDTELSPALIEINLKEGSGWVVDEKASTPERMILYYTKALPVGESTSDLCSSLRISPDILSEVTEEITDQTSEGMVIKTSYKYDGYWMNLEAEVDAVQAHNAEKAIKSAWGVDVVIGADGSLRLQP